MLIFISLFCLFFTGIFGQSSPLPSNVTVVKLLPSDGSQSDRFGHSVSVDSSGLVALVGAPNAAYRGSAVNISNVGAGYIFNRSSQDSTEWTEQGKLQDDAESSSPTDSNSGCGHASALSPDALTAVITCYGSKVNNVTAAGSALVFSRASRGETFQQTALLTAEGFDGGLEPSAQYGYAVAISGDSKTIVIGSPYRTVNGISRAGAAFVHRRESSSSNVWTAEATFAAGGDGSDSMVSSYFGNSVALSHSGNRAVIGAWYHLSGRGEVYDRDGSGSWSLTATLIPEPQNITSGELTPSRIGSSVSCSFDCGSVLLGAEGSGPIRSGAAFLYAESPSSSSFVQQAAFVDEDGHEENSQYGISTSLSGDARRLVVGAQRKDESFNNNGAAYVYSADSASSSWTRDAKISAGSDGDSEQLFSWLGFSTSISADSSTVIVGAYGRDEIGGQNSGAAYIVHMSKTWDPPMTTESSVMATESTAASDSLGQESSNAVTSSSQLSVTSSVSNLVDSSTGAGLSSSSSNDNENNSVPIRLTTAVFIACSLCLLF